MRRVLATAVVLIVSGFGLSACGEDEGNSTADSGSDSGACVILVNGNKLCGADAKAYCEQFAQDAPDVSTRLARARTGAVTTSPETDAQAAEDEQDRKIDEARLNRTEKAEKLGAPFRAAVEQAAGPNRVTSVEAYLGSPTVVVNTTWSAKPSEARLRMISDAVEGVDPAKDVQVRDKTEEIIYPNP